MDAIAVSIATLISGWLLPTQLGQRDALMVAMATGGTLILKSLNPWDESYGVGHLTSAVRDVFDDHENLLGGPGRSPH